MLNKKHKGLTDQEVIASREKNGSNELNSKEQKSFLRSLWDTFNGDPIIKILTVALIIQVVFFFFGHGDWYEPVGIAIAVLIATIVGTWAEFSGEQKFQELQEEASQIKCKVYRNGRIEEVLIGDIVVGDKILLQSGDKIPADGILVEGHLDLNQASLNGESKLAEKKTAPEGFDFNSNEFDEEDSPLLNPYKIYRDTVVSEGEGVLEVLFVGEKTLSGQQLNDDEEEVVSPLTHKLDNLASGISKVGYIGAAVIFLAFMSANAFLYPNVDPYFTMDNLGYIGSDVVNAFVLAVVTIVVVVPEGLPMMIAMVLSINMRKLLKDNILVRKIIGIETAGSMNILFSDKTGTITKGQLEVVNFTDATSKEYSKTKKLPADLQKLVDLAITKNTNAVKNIDSSTGQVEVLGGNATERALLTYASNEEMKLNVKQVDSISFNSKNKYSATQVSGDYNTTLLKGAPEILLGKAKYFYNEKGEKEPLTNEMIQKLNQHIDILAEKAIRVLALATVDSDISEGKVDFEDATLIGVLGIRDDLRDTSKEAIKSMQDAGIQVVMITGDRKETAVAIAKESGLIQTDNDLVFTSKELNEMSDEEIKEKMPHIRVIARALPQDKFRLVKLAQELNLVAGMTGDGVNDAPALEKADVGFAMGSGTEVAKESSDIVILDDNFKSIAQTTLYGRTIYNSIQKFIVYQLTVNVAAISVILVGPFVGVDLPLSMTQMLWINLVMDTLAALAFGGEPALRKYMAEKPKDRSESIISKPMWSSILGTGGFIAIMSILFLLLPAFASQFEGMVEGASISKPLGSDVSISLTAFFTFFMLMHVFNMFNARVTDTKLFSHITENKGFLKVVVAIVGLQLLMTYVGGDILRTYGLSLYELGFITAVAFLVIPFDLLRKKLFTKK